MTNLFPCCDKKKGEVVSKNDSVICFCLANLPSPPRHHLPTRHLGTSFVLFRVEMSLVWTFLIDDSNFSIRVFVFQRSWHFYSHLVLYDNFFCSGIALLWKRGREKELNTRLREEITEFLIRYLDETLVL